MKKINQVEPAYDQAEIDAVVQYLQGGGWITEHAKTRELEAMIASYVGSRFCTVLPNGTLTLWAALAVCKIGIGDEVIVPDFTMVATANAVVLSGAKPVFVDIDRNSLCLDYEKTLEKITSKTKAIFLVSINGRCPEIKKFKTFCDQKNILLLEDSAQSLGSKVGGKNLGTFGTFGSFSFSMPKVITMGQGGALVTDDEEKHAILKKFKDFGRSEPGADKYEMLGYNLKFTDLQAVFGIEQMKKLKTRTEKKKEILRWYQELLKDVSEVVFIKSEEGNVPWFVDVLVPDRDSLSRYLKEQGIATRDFYPTLHSLPFYDQSGSFPSATYVSERGLWLPSGTELTHEDVESVCKEIRKFYSK